MRLNRSDIRRRALNKLAALSTATGCFDEQDSQQMQQLCQLTVPWQLAQQNGSSSNHNEGDDSKANDLSAVALSVRELEVLVALCKAAPNVKSGEDADLLLTQISPYAAEAHKQALQPSPLHENRPPWEKMSYILTAAILAIARNHPSLRSKAQQVVMQAISDLHESAKAASEKRIAADRSGRAAIISPALSTLQLTVSILGVLRALELHVEAWSGPERLSLLAELHNLLSAELMITIEGALSAIRHSHVASRIVRDWKGWLRNYEMRGASLGAMLLRRAFMQVVERCVLLLVFDEAISHGPILDSLLQGSCLIERQISSDTEHLERITEIVIDELDLLDADADYLQVSSSSQQQLVFDVKARCLSCYLLCALRNGTAADDELLLAWLTEAALDPTQMLNQHLAETVLKAMGILGQTSTGMAAALSRTMPRMLVHGGVPPDAARLAGECLASVMKQLSQDIAISTLYSLGNILTADPQTEDQRNSGAQYLNGSANVDGHHHMYLSQHSAGSALSLVASNEEETTAVYTTLIRAIVAVAVKYQDEKTTALVNSMLLQKIDRINPAVDAAIIAESAALGLSGGVGQLRNLLRFYARVSGEATVANNVIILDAVADARIRLAKWVANDPDLFETYLMHILRTSVSCGDTAGDRTSDLALALKSIKQLLRPTAILIASFRGGLGDRIRSDILEVGRDSWFNMVAHGFTLNSPAVDEFADELEVLSRGELPLIDEARVDMPESGIDLNPVLRRGNSTQNHGHLKAVLLNALPQCETEIKSYSYPDCVFLNAALLNASLRAKTGNCTASLPLFMENKVKKTSMSKVMLAIVNQSVDVYLERVLSGQNQSFGAAHVAKQLAIFFEGSCHRIANVQHAAVVAADRIIARIPSALCQRTSLYALLELLTLLWRSCLDAETDEYQTIASYSSRRGGVSIQVSDDFGFRQKTLTNFHNRCRSWVATAVDLAPLDIKCLLQAYLEDFEDDGSYGHIALGRSFALEMGSRIPGSDQRLSSLDRQQGIGLNTASDFIAQYTTRQEYRQYEGLRQPADDDWTLVDRDGTMHTAATFSARDAGKEAGALKLLARRLRNHEKVPFQHVREVLHHAAGMLSKDSSDRAALITDLVGIPFALFTKQAINLGVSLWLGVVKEDPTIESRLLAEVATGWETTVRLGKGFFDRTVHHLDPFYVKEEFAPSNWNMLTKRQRSTLQLLAPHTRLTHFLTSQFNASRLTGPAVERILARSMRITMLSMKRTAIHPLARELHFQIVSLALRVLRQSKSLKKALKWRLTDSILAAGLAWFARSPKWSFGSNRLQVKAELRLLESVLDSLKASEDHIPLLKKKRDLLVLLVEVEIQRLMVWISPLANDSRGLTMPLLGRTPAISDADFVPLLETAWIEDPSIAVHLLNRFPTSQRLHAATRALLLRDTVPAIHEPDAIGVLLGQSLPADTKEQLKFLLYWAPINPMAAVTHFLPAYASHPLILQYAVRALESHSVDVTFFYVPQIVQTLRYDGLGYVERYIVEAAKFSQLFAHQIIWNIKANAYRDEDSQVPDPVKPTLDQVENALIASFSQRDRDFYRREFDFFGKVTGISGTLKPFIKRPKPEKKQKIEEELRKIDLDVGVYLPSNPDGVVVGIDRKSGKPLQSHAKAPFMATFRIRKEEIDVEGSSEDQSDEPKAPKTYEVWQSAIFKVGDDCRQDVLALQMIAAFRGIFNTIGLDVYVFPYRVTATAPGCGVIDVLPNSISRDMLGREAVNGLFEYFVSKYGHEDSVRFQEARSNFVKSMAAYSIISFLLQFKDRHNGNIMVDDAGHLLHIDFGFCFDVVPGGVKFERAPFKLSPEMVAVMGGIHSQPFRAFEELCVKAFLASRQYVDQLSHIVMTMLDSGLPCFKPQTMNHFRERFVLEKGDKEAAAFVRHLVHVSERSYSTGVYDYFQLLTNGIPY